MADHDKLKADLARSGYSVPDSHFAEDPNATQQSAEQTSGDGGRAAADIDQTASEHGYHGKMLTQEDLANKAKSGPASNKNAAETGLGETQFASAAARTAAEQAGIPASAFAGVEPSSENGYTKADVEGVVARGGYAIADRTPE